MSKLPQSLNIYNVAKENIEECWLSAMDCEPSDDVLKALGKK